MKTRGLELAKWLAQQLDKKAARNIVVLDLRKRSDIADYLVVATGTSSTHRQTLLESPVREMKKIGFPPLAIEGQRTGWAVADFGDVMMHVFDEPTRQFYDLETLWGTAERVIWAADKPAQMIAL